MKRHKRNMRRRRNPNTAAGQVEVSGVSRQSSSLLEKAIELSDSGWKESRAAQGTEEENAGGGSASSGRMDGWQSSLCDTHHCVRRVSKWFYKGYFRFVRCSIWLRFIWLPPHLSFAAIQGLLRRHANCFALTALAAVAFMPLLLALPAHYHMESGSTRMRTVSTGQVSTNIAEDLGGFGQQGVDFDLFIILVLVLGCISMLLCGCIGASRDNDAEKLRKEKEEKAQVGARTFPVSSRDTLNLGVHASQKVQNVDLQTNKFVGEEDDMDKINMFKVGTERLAADGLQQFMKDKMGVTPKMVHEMVHGTRAIEAEIEDAVRCLRRCVRPASSPALVFGRAPMHLPLRTQFHAIVE